MSLAPEWLYGSDSLFAMLFARPLTAMRGMFGGAGAGRLPGDG